MNQLTDFNVDCFLACAKELVRADEIERALWLLSNLPAYYRDNQPVEVINLRNQILSRVATPGSYKLDDSNDIIPDCSNAKTLLRYQLIAYDVARLNNLSLVPHIVDYGPGEFWLPILLHQDGHQFTYQPIFLSDQAFDKTKHIYEAHLKLADKSAPTIYVACEIIEHLWNDVEIKTEMLRASGLCDIVHLSTPKYSFDYQRTTWDAAPIFGHLRAYTPDEFYLRARMIFGEYDNFTFYDSQILHTRCMLRGAKIEPYQIQLKEDSGL